MTEVDLGNGHLEVRVRLPDHRYYFTPKTTFDTVEDWNLTPLEREIILAQLRNAALLLGSRPKKPIFTNTKEQ